MNGIRQHTFRDLIEAPVRRAWDSIGRLITIIDAAELLNHRKKLTAAGTSYKQYIQLDMDAKSKPFTGVCVFNYNKCAQFACICMVIVYIKL